MKTLVIHPKDVTTTLFDRIYIGLNFTVIRGNIEQDSLRYRLQEYDRIIMIGHGSSSGLLSMDKFIECNSYIVDKTFSKVLSDNNRKNYFIWCYADQFRKENKLSGFATGMFISEYSEAVYLGIKASPKDITDSNALFVELMRKHFLQDLSIEDVIEVYGKDTTNPIILYNHSRLSVYWNAVDDQEDLSEND